MSYAPSIGDFSEQPPTPTMLSNEPIGPAIHMAVAPPGGDISEMLPLTLHFVVVPPSGDLYEMSDVRPNPFALGEYQPPGAHCQNEVIPPGSIYSFSWQDPGPAIELKLSNEVPIDGMMSEFKPPSMSMSDYAPPLAMEQVPIGYSQYPIDPLTMVQ